MQLFQCWKESLTLFKPANLKLFFLITVKSIWEVYKTLFRYFWPLIFAILILHIYKRQYQMPKWLSLLDVTLHLLFVFFVFVAARSSVPKKTISYFIRHLPFFIPFAVWIVALYSFEYLIMYEKLVWYVQLVSVLFAIMTGALGWLVIRSLLTVRNVARLAGHMHYSIFAELLQSWFVPLGTFFTLFMLDSDGRPLTLLRSLHRAMTMVYYNYPAIILLYIGSAFVYGLILFLLLLTPAWEWAPWSLFFSPIPISIFTNFYIKFVHSQFSLYFGQKKTA